jgi:hypothetical protein
LEGQKVEQQVALHGRIVVNKSRFLLSRPLFLIDDDIAW